ncbi:VPLPA-CTERM-specific exosortase XrtD [Thiohalobacter sp. IOR34]|uniref:VPLPA-CTERM-specific exosortase XrtD n=1 Tax=Thiohalobacter sp. IOR34 TaxID=3057176 RepID=UPI0025B1163B|nr:VPLPA-CTERM-specific exosortase XrtD [Thiohalobacter sp. IOR34]WJW75293.1 VPLPA-CTERM-specific exosortase XrtD [Thiohalobacter sp. IOR34]
MNNDLCWKNSSAIYLILGLAVLLMGAGYMDTIADMVHRWDTKEEYGYGYLIPVISAFLVWQRKNDLARQEFSPSWMGVVVVAISGLLFFMGAVATTHTLSQYALVLAVLGVALAIMGWRAFKIVAVPLALLFFMVPLPPFIYNTLSTKLQLISSELGVAVIRLFGISVYLEGNVIDLGTFKLQVVEACSGLRYLFPLVSLSFIAAYIYKADLWKKALVFLSSIPITVLMNSFRIGVIGVLVEYYGIEQAEGFLHDFEGWFIFMACMGILILEMMLLSRVGEHKMKLSEAFAIDLPDSISCTRWSLRSLRTQHFAVVFLAAGILAGSLYAQGRSEQEMPRKVFAEFPLQFGDWRGRDDRLEEIYLRSLKLDDYILANYVDKEGGSVNLYIAYYNKQEAGSAAHSPRACIPGGGWLIKDHSVVHLGDVSVNGKPLSVNRMIIKKGDYTQLVYYWFQQRGRDITSEWLVKWFMFWDALTRNRTDGALVRLTALVGPGDDIEDAERRLRLFARVVVPLLTEYIPD